MKFKTFFNSIFGFMGILFLLPIIAAAATGNNAQFVSQSVPASMVAGKTYSVSVTMKNTGTSSWTAAGNYRLGSQNPQDNFNWGDGRKYLLPGESIAPGQTKTFSFTISAPTSFSDYNLQWQMVQDGVEWFGERTSNAAIKIASCFPGAAFGCKICKSDGSGWVDDDSKCSGWQTCNDGICVTDEKPLSKDLFKYSVFSGANVLQKSSCWIPDDMQTDIIMKSAKQMHLRVLRLPILTYVAYNNANNDCWGTDHIKNFLDKAQANNLKVIIVLDGYMKYDGYCVGWKPGFNDVDANGVKKVQEGAKQIVALFKNHPALFAWDLVNEPLWSADSTLCADNTYCCKNDAARASVIKAVNAMHDLVRSIDGETPLTVGEGKDEYISTWNAITNFASPHIYSGTNISNFKNRLNYLKSKVGSLPLVIGEFGISVPGEASEAARANAFTSIYQVMEKEDAGSMFWSLSTDDDQAGFSLISSDGSFKATANSVAQSLPADINNAQFVSQSVPSFMIAGKTYSVSVTMKNIGTSSWTEASKFRLGSQNSQDNGIWGAGRIALALTDSIGASASKTFTFYVKAPLIPGTYNFQWQMVQDGVEWFGERTSNVVVVVGSKAASSTVSEKDLESIGCGMSVSTFQHQACRAKRWCVSKGYVTGFQTEWGSTIGTIQCVSDADTFNVSEKDLESMGCGMSVSTFQHQACRAKRWCVSKGYTAGFQSEWGNNSGTIQCISGTAGFDVSYKDLDATGCAASLEDFQRQACRASRWCVSKGYATGFQTEWGASSGGVFCLGAKEETAFNKISSIQASLVSIISRIKELLGRWMLNY